MSLLQFSADNRTTVNWASGTSTELYIYPPTASFAARDFLFRISTATVEAEESTFTFFEGITRHLMILKGELDLIHEGRYSKQLRPFDQDTFSGEWPTRSKGKVTDFNLMLKKGAAGSLKHLRIQVETTLEFSAHTAYYFLYLVSGSAAQSNGKQLNTGDLLQLPEGTKISLSAREQCEVIEITVSLI